jgi:hypothetical protein
MPRAVFAVLGILLISVSSSEIAAGAWSHAHKAKHASANRQFQNSNNSARGIGISAAARSVYCQNREPGNPYDRETDFAGWSAWRQLGAWDSRNDC